MDLFEAIHTRRSIRSYTDEPVSDEELRQILEAGMAAPTARNTQCWRFLVINDRELLAQTQTVQPFSRMAAKAPLAVLVCCDLTESFQPGDYWTVDGAAAIENMLLAARALNLGTCWCAAYPNPEYTAGFVRLFHLPDHIRPVGLVVIGHPAKPFTRQDRFDQNKIRYNRWDELA